MEYNKEFICRMLDRATDREIRRRRASGEPVTEKQVSKAVRRANKKLIRDLGDILLREEIEKIIEQELKKKQEPKEKQ